MISNYKPEEIISIIDHIINGTFYDSENKIYLLRKFKELEFHKEVNTELKIEKYHRPYEKLIIFLKKSIRRITRWYINPIMAQQNYYNKLLYEFNDLLLKYIDDLDNTVRTQTEQINNLKLELSDNNEKFDNYIKENAKQKLELLEKISNNSCDLKLLKKSYNNISDSKDITYNDHSLDFDYELFEKRYRGTTDDILSRQEIYLPYFKDRTNIIDIGCGRGEFLEILKKNQISSIGIDLSEHFINYCKNIGLNAIQSDMFVYLDKLDNSSVGGIFCSQVVEHITSEQLIKFVQLAFLKLKNGAPLVIETINPLNITAVSNWFYMDPSHVRPVHPNTLSFIAETNGFTNIKLLYLHANDNEQIPKLNIDGAEEFNNKINKVNECLFGPQDYAMIAYKNVESIKS